MRTVGLDRSARIVCGLVPRIFFCGTGDGDWRLKTYEEGNGVSRYDGTVRSCRDEVPCLLRLRTLRNREDLNPVKKTGQAKCQEP